MAGAEGEIMPPGECQENVAGEDTWELGLEG